MDRLRTLRVESRGCSFEAPRDERKRSGSCVTRLRGPSRNGPPDIRGREWRVAIVSRHSEISLDVRTKNQNKNLTKQEFSTARENNKDERSRQYRARRDEIHNGRLAQRLSFGGVSELPSRRSRTYAICTLTNPCHALCRLQSAG